MKRIALLLLVLLAGFTACKKEEKKTETPKETYKCPTCPTASEANPAFDASSAGVYKGVIVGSTGTIALYLYNSGTVVNALVVFDGKSGTLTTTDLSGWAPGQAVTDALFTGVIDGKTVEAKFTVEANGANPRVELLIPGHTVVVGLYKETSANLIKNYEGTYAGSDQGVFNMVTSADAFTIVTDNGGKPFGGTLVGGKIDLNGNGVTIKGEFSGDDVSGTWANTKESTSGTWTGKRTL